MLYFDSFSPKVWQDNILIIIIIIIIIILLLLLLYNAPVITIPLLLSDRAYELGIR